MNERIEAWKARERLRSDILFPVASLGISGAGGIVIGLLAMAGVIQDFRPIQPPLFVLLGAGLLVCVVGLWNARPWARWTAVALCGVSLASILVDLAREGGFPKGALWPSFLIVYLLLPSTGRRFGRAQLLRQPGPLLTQDTRP